MRAYLLHSLVLLCCCLPAHALSLQLRARGTIPHKLMVGKTKVGGLSGISYDSASGEFWAVSDDSQGVGGPPRIYRIKLSLGSGADLNPQVEEVQILKDANLKNIAPSDCEAIACTGRGAAWVASEGLARKTDSPPWLRLFSLKDGRMLRELPPPPVYLPKDAAGESVPVADARQKTGVESNRSLESCAVSSDLRTVIIANEASLIQERCPGEGKSGASFFNSTQIRISALDAKTGKCLNQKLYKSDAGCFFGSISDVEPLDDQGNLLVLERRVVRLEQRTGSVGGRIYQVDLNQASATDVRDLESVTGTKVESLQKTLVYDSVSENFPDMDNLEGMTLVPLPGGKRGLVTVSDDNFSDIQQTQILLYELND